MDFWELLMQISCFDNWEKCNLENLQVGYSEPYDH